MNPEKKQQLKVCAKLLVVVICATLYAWGGMEMKWLRRFLAPAICCLSCFGFSRDLRYIMQLPFMCLTLSMGYGADTLMAKVARRGLFGACNGYFSSFVNHLHGNYLLVFMQVGVLIAAYILLGVWNPMPSARAEETLLGVFVFLIPMLSCKDYESKT